MGQPVIDAELVRTLIREQFPAWSDLPVEFVPQGWDHRTFRLGSDLSVRLPSAEGYVPQGAKEQRWLPILAPHLTLPIPEPVAQGAPGAGFPYPWSVYRWMSGSALPADSVVDDPAIARDVAEFLISLQGVDGTDGPAPGIHSAFRGSPPVVWNEDVLRCLPLLSGARRGRAEEVWRAACASEPTAPPVWLHGDVAPGNLVLRDGALAAVIDFGCSAVGDPACDVAAAWMMFDGGARSTFLSTLAPDQGMLERGRGWALWKALLWLEEDQGSAAGARTLDAVISD